MQIATIITPSGQTIEIDVRRDARRRHGKARVARWIAFGLPIALFLMLLGH